jgi:hypothetical protein
MNNATERSSRARQGVATLLAERGWSRRLIGAGWDGLGPHVTKPGRIMDVVLDTVGPPIRLWDRWPYDRRALSPSMSTSSDMTTTSRTTRR